MVTTTQAAAMLGLSRDAFRADVVPYLRPVTVRRRTAWPVVELQRWMSTRMEPAAYD